MAALTYSIREVALALGISPSTAYRQVRAGEIPSRRIGRRVVVPKRALDEWLVNRESAA